MSAPNPFADDPLPDNIVRLTSIADPLDPYAAPSGVSEYQTARNPGVGMWRDRKWLVMHREATFPPRCIFTNEPTDTFGKQTISWAHLNDLRGRTVIFNYGVTERAYRRARRNRMIALSVVVVAVVLLTLLIAFVSQNPPLRPPFALLPMLLIGILAGATKVAYDASNPLRYSHTQKDYIWLRGTRSAFLDSLPNWPGLLG